MRSFFIWSVVASAPFLLAACGGNVVSATTGADGGAGGETSTPSTTGGNGGGGSGGEATTSVVTAASAGGSGGTGGSGGIGGTAGSGGSGGGSVCNELAPIMLSDPGFMDAGGDGKWSPGESAAVFVTMNNTTFADVQYPGIFITSDNPLVSAGNPYNAFFVLFGAQSAPIEVGFVADAAVPAGTVVHFVATLMDIQANLCDELPALEFDLVIE